VISWLSRPRDNVVLLTAVLAMTATIALGDRALGTRVSLGPLYILPMITAALTLNRPQIIALSALCTYLRALFDTTSPTPLESILRETFAFISYTGAGLFVIALIRNHEASKAQLARIRREQDLRRQAEEQLKILVESSPAAILTTDSGGVVLAANKAADRLLMMPEGQTLTGRAIGPYLPMLADALKFDSGPEGLRTAAQCQGFRDNGEIFLASVWFSSWNAGEGMRLAAIVVDSSEEMRDREEESLRHLVRSNQIAASAVSHEVRNLCGAISAVSANLRARHEAGSDDDIQALGSLVAALEKIASLEPHRHGGDALSEISLQSVLDDLRIVIEPQWREIDGSVRWATPGTLPPVIGERHGLLLAFLNLAHNSHRAVMDRPVRELNISIDLQPGKVVLKFRDSGPGVAAPGRLFVPFQPAADGTGLGLYISRAVLRSYGGDLRLDSGDRSCFVIELESVEGVGDE
jgi:signal transduction histidine kinase